MLFNLNDPLGLSKKKVRFLKLKVVNFCILDKALYWKNFVGILLKFLLEEDADRIMHDFHEAECGGHLYWKTTANKILRAGFYWPTLFPDIHKLVVTCHKCQIFDGKRKLFPLPLHPISVETPFQQRGLYFIGEIHPTSSSQHKLILTATNYFIKWI